MKLWSDTYLTFTFSFNAAENQRKRVTVMYSMRYVRGHVQVYDGSGRFLFSADNEREAREELENDEESAA